MSRLVDADHVIIKGVRDGLLVLLDDSAAWPDLLADLDLRLSARRAFFQGATVTVNLGARIIDEPEFGALRRLLGQLDMTLAVVVSTSTQTRAVAAVNGVRNRAPAFGRNVDLAAAPAAPTPNPSPKGRGELDDLNTDSTPSTQNSALRTQHSATGRGEFDDRAAAPTLHPALFRSEQPADLVSPVDERAEPDFRNLQSTDERTDSAIRNPQSAIRNPQSDEPDFGALAGEDDSPAADPAWAAGVPGALFVRRTLRSGMQILHDGDVCILGDVNAGAEIVAGGDIVVWGALRGMVHAGAGGDTAAVVCALLLAPTQLRIADRVSRGSAPSGPGAPEQARIVAAGIAVELWSGRRK